MADSTENTDLLDETNKSQITNISNLFSNKKRNAIIIAGLLASGSGAAFAYSRLKEPSPEPSTEFIPELKEGEEIKVNNGTLSPSENACIGHINDEMDFETAFEAARIQTGPGGIFTWHGNVYNTYEKEEWAGLSLEQRQSFLNDIGFKTEVVEVENKTQKVGIQQPTRGPENTPEPAYFETEYEGKRVIGIDIDRDGVIDSIVYASEDGNTIMIVDSYGTDALDTIFTIDPLTNQTINISEIEIPTVLTNNQFQTMYHESNICYELNNEINENVTLVDSSKEVNNLNNHVIYDTVDVDPNDIDTVEDDPDYANNGDIGDLD
jgi:hypothetical protein